MRRGLQKLFLKLIILAIPLLIAQTALLLYANSIGETISIASVIEQQAQSDRLIIYNPADNARILAYKVQAVETYQPHVVMLGSSRVLDFRGDVVNRVGSRFYNASIQGLTLSELHAFIEEVDYIPDVLIIGLDQIWFGENYRPQRDPLAPRLSFLDNVDYTQNAIVNLVQSVASGEVDFADLQDSKQDETVQQWGLQAIDTGLGYQADGSFYVGAVNYQTSENRIAIHLDQARRGVGGYAYGDDVSTDNLIYLVDILQIARAKNMVIIGFMNTYHESIYEEINNTGRHDYVESIRPLVRQIFAEAGYAFYDFTDIRSLGIKDPLFMDGYHPAEQLTGQMYLTLVQEFPEILADFTNVDALQGYLQTVPNPFNFNSDTVLARPGTATTNSVPIVADDALLQAGIQSWQAENYQEALIYIDQALEQDNTRADAWYWRGLTNQRLGDLVTAVADFTKSIELDDSRLQAFIFRGTTYRTLGQFDLARADLEYALAQNPDNTSLYFQLAVLNEREGNIEQASLMLDEYLERGGDANNPNVQNLMQQLNN